jgi:guanylate kinase
MTGNGNKIIIITAPSGAGKTSITKYLLQNFPQLEFSVSAATRESRSHEKEGKDYYFLTEESFLEKIRNNEFLEWEMVYEGKYYGTLKSELDRIWNMDKVPVLDIDVKGAIHVQGQYPNSSLSIFIEPPSVNELKRRLESRGTESLESLQARVNKAAYEISFKDHFNHVIVNNDLTSAQRIAFDIIDRFLKSSKDQLASSME